MSAVTKICSVLAQPQPDLLPEDRFKPDYWSATTGAYASADETRTSGTGSPASIAFSATGEEKTITLSTSESERIRLTAKRTYVFSASLYAMDEFPVRIAAACYDGAGRLLTTRFSTSPAQQSTETLVWTHMSGMITLPERTHSVVLHIEVSVGEEPTAIWLDDVSADLVAHVFTGNALVKQLAASAIGGKAKLTVSLVGAGETPELRHRLLSETAVPSGEPYTKDFSQVANQGDYLLLSSDGAAVACAISGVDIA